MRRLLAGIVVVAVAGVVMAGCGSGAPRRGAARDQVSAAAVKATPRLKRLLGAEIRTLRTAQPKGTRVSKAPPVTVIPENGRTCFIAAGCSDTPCRKFADAPAVLRLRTGVVRVEHGRLVIPGVERGKPACLPPPRKLVPVSAP